MKKRNTIQKTLVMKTMMELQYHATADEVYANLNVKYPIISRGTVYRNLNALSDTGEIRKVEVPGGADRYDYRCENHYHVKCMRCGKLYDVDMDYVVDLDKQIRDKQGFLFLGHDIVFRGICPKCDE